jgi:aspartyl-tRNA(Asn)/glutamyl-tRNA(Gln) amidotransferase subunit C
MNDADRRHQAEPITKEVFRHLVELAALELDDEEAAYLRRELNGQLRAIRDLEAIKLPEQTAITSHGVPYPPAIRPRLRPDQIKPGQLADAILAQAPQREGRYIVVPDIPHTDLE